MSCSRQVRAVFLAVAFGTLAGGVAPRQPGAETLDAIAFEYGIVGRTAQCPDSLFLVKDGVTLRSGDQIRITVRRMPDTCFYVILQMSNGDYTLFHAAPGATPADPMIESLRWLMLDDDTGVETIHLVASAEPLTSLERSLAAYDASRGERRAALASEIASHLPGGLDTEIGGSESLMPLARIDSHAPLGWTYRGPYDGRNASRYLFTRCAGDTIAADRVRIIHQ